MFFKSRIAELEAKLAEVTTTAQGLSDDVAALQAANDAFATSDTALRLQVETLTGEKATLETQLAEAVARADKAEGSVHSKVIETIASAGVPAITRDPAAKSEAVTMTRADFSKLSPGQRMAHIKSGGKLVD